MQGDGVSNKVYSVLVPLLSTVDTAFAVEAGVGASDDVPMVPAAAQGRRASLMLADNIILLCEGAADAQRGSAFMQELENLLVSSRIASQSSTMRRPWLDTAPPIAVIIPAFEAFVPAIFVSVEPIEDVSDDEVNMAPAKPVTFARSPSRRQTVITFDGSSFTPSGGAFGGMMPSPPGHACPRRNASFSRTPSNNRASMPNLMPNSSPTATPNSCSSSGFISPASVPGRTPADRRRASVLRRSSATDLGANISSSGRVLSGSADAAPVPGRSDTEAYIPSSGALFTHSHRRGAEGHDCAAPPSSGVASPMFANSSTRSARLSTSSIGNSSPGNHGQPQGLTSIDGGGWVRSGAGTANGVAAATAHGGARPISLMSSGGRLMSMFKNIFHPGQLQTSGDGGSGGDSVNVISSCSVDCDGELLGNLEASPGSLSLPPASLRASSYTGGHLHALLRSGSTSRSTAAHALIAVTTTAVGGRSSSMSAAHHFASNPQTRAGVNSTGGGQSLYPRPPSMPSPDGVGTRVATSTSTSQNHPFIGGCSNDLLVLEVGVLHSYVPNSSRALRPSSNRALRSSSFRVVQPAPTPE